MEVKGPGRIGPNLQKVFRLCLKINEDDLKSKFRKRSLHELEDN